MFVSACLVLAMVAPAAAPAGASTTPAPSAPARVYDGPKDVVPEAGVGEPEVVAPGSETEPGKTEPGKTEPGKTGGTTGGTVTTGGMLPPVVTPYVPKKKRPVPRPLRDTCLTLNTLIAKDKREVFLGEGGTSIAHIGCNEP